MGRLDEDPGGAAADTWVQRSRDNRVIRVDGWRKVWVWVLPGGSMVCDRNCVIVYIIIVVAMISIIIICRHVLLVFLCKAEK